METTNKVKIVGLNDHPLTDLNQFMQPPITTMEEFNRVLYSDVGEDGDYWDETFSDDWDDDLARPDDFPITCVISDDGKNLHYMFQVTYKAYQDSMKLALISLDNQLLKDRLTTSEDKGVSDLICFDFDYFMDKVKVRDFIVNSVTENIDWIRLPLS